MVKEQAKPTTPKPTTKKHAGGRPTKLTRELVDRAATYIESTKMGGANFGDLPTLEGLAIYLDITRSTLYEWRKLETPLGLEFSDIIGRVETFQAYKLIGKSLKGEYNPTITKLLLSKHGYVEKQEIDNTHKGEVTFTNDVPRPARGGDA